MDEQSVIKNTNNWTRCHSKSRPGQYYMFNKKTKETRWCTKSKEKFKMGTPAQDRLKRLQKNLEKTKHKDSSLVKSKDGSSTSRLDLSSDQQTVKPESANEKTSSTNSTKITEKTSTTKRTAEKSKSQGNIEQSSPVASDDQKNGVQSDRNIFRIPKKPTTPQNTTSKKKVEKRKHNEVLKANLSCSSVTKEQLSKSTNNSSSLVCSPKKVRISHELETDQQTTCPDSENNVQCDLNDNVEPSKDQKTIISLIKGYCTTFFKKVAHKGNKLNDETKKSNLSQNSKPSFKSKKLVPKGSQHKNQNAQRPIPQNNGNITLTSSSPKGCANERLQRLRKSLQDQQISLNRTDDISYSPSSSVVSNPSYLSVSSLSTSHLESESMDWQPIYEDTPLNNNTTSSSLPNMSNVSSSNVSIRSEHWDTVNENLLRLAADKKQQEKHWKTDYFYFVVDTNVFLENVTFVDELTTMKLCDTAGTIIYIPYCVLQELDKLKIRSPSESIKTRSIRAIHFINKAFESGAHYIQAQSSEDENKHLIKVTSPDDSILNCCLQVKAHMENVMLLTEDINLRNKAMCSDILVSTKSDLISKHKSLL